jgi:hypothetical protein
MIPIIIIIVIVGVFYYAKGNPRVNNLSNWQHLFDQEQFSSKEFYAAVEEGVRKRQLPDVSFSRKNLSEGGIFASRREYLRVSRNEYTFDICCAPFGTGSFISWWLGEKDEGIIERIPILNTIAGKNRETKTYYQIDTETMFRSAVHAVVMAAVDDISKAKGYRALSELERQPKDTGGK